MIVASQNQNPCGPSHSTPGAPTTTWYTNHVLFDGTPITVPSGFTGSVNNLDVPQNAVVFTVAGSLLTVTSGAENGEYLHIFGLQPIT